MSWFLWHLVQLLTSPNVLVLESFGVGYLVMTLRYIAVEDYEEMRDE